MEHITVEALLEHPRFPEIHKEYVAECANPALSDGEIDVARYKAMEAAGVLHVLADKDGDDIVGFSVVIISPVLHFTKTIAVVESIYLLPEHRTGLRGLKLMRSTCDYARKQGADGVYMSAPTGSAFDKLCQALRLSHTNNTYFVGLR